MVETTLESLSERMAELERKMADLMIGVPGAVKDWRRTVGMFEGDAFSKAVDAEALAIREAERQAAREGN